jgi:hypothetical protein
MLAASRKKLVGIALIVITVLLSAWVVGRAIAWGACSWYGHQTERDTRYAAFIGCMVKVDQQWVPRNELRIVQ